MSFHFVEKVCLRLDNECKLCCSFGRKSNIQVVECFFHFLCEQILCTHTYTEVHKHVKGTKVFEDSYKHAKVRG